METGFWYEMQVLWYIYREYKTFDFWMSQRKKYLVYIEYFIWI